MGELSELDELELAFLADREDCLPQLADWFTRAFATWFAPGTGRDAAATFRERLRRDGIPCAFVALEHGSPVGTVSLMTASIEPYAHLTPWVGGLFVASAARSRGVGMALVAHAVQTAACFGVQGLHGAVHARPDVYVAAGWELLESTTYQGDRIHVLSITPHPSRDATDEPPDDATGPRSDRPGSGAARAG